ncbi:hypothetical protein [Streptomyces sp. NPDC001903]|uniref:hypothetical protein n=1 Tax=Streptomyces sp. NPDC001903 TaxID=3364622 RepID=UPI0036A86280
MYFGLGVQSGVRPGRGGAGGGWGPRFGFCGICEVRGGEGFCGRAPGVSAGSGVPPGSGEAGEGVGDAEAGEGVGLVLGLALVPGVGEPDFSGAGDAPSAHPPSSRAPASRAVTDIGALPWGLTPTGHLLEHDPVDARRA